jgi:hypothetical protein
LVPLGVRTVDGIEHQVDSIVYADDEDCVLRTLARPRRLHPSAELVKEIV